MAAGRLPACSGLESGRYSPWRVSAGFGGGLLFAGLRMQHDHAVLGTRGATATAVVTEVHSGRGGPTVDVRFTAADGREVRARVEDADSPGGLYEGSPIEVRYDPLDPAGRIESARGRPCHRHPLASDRRRLAAAGPRRLRRLLVGLAG